MPSLGINMPLVITPPTAEEGLGYLITPKDKVISNVGSFIKNSKKRIDWSFEVYVAGVATNHLVTLMHSVSSMRVRISVDNVLRHESQQKKGVPKWVYLFSIDTYKCAITVDFNFLEDPYFLYIDDVPFNELSLKPGTPGSPRNATSSLIPTDVAKSLPSSSKWAYKGEEDPAGSLASPKGEDDREEERDEEEEEEEGEEEIKEKKIKKSKSKRKMSKNEEELEAPVINRRKSKQHAASSEDFEGSKPASNKRKAMRDKTRSTSFGGDHTKVTDTSDEVPEPSFTPFSPNKTAFGAKSQSVLSSTPFDDVFSSSPRLHETTKHMSQNSLGLRVNTVNLEDPFEALTLASPSFSSPTMHQRVPSNTPTANDSRILSYMRSNPSLGSIGSESSSTLPSSPFDLSNQMAFLPKSVLNSPPMVVESRGWANSDTSSSFIVPSSPTNIRAPPTSPYLAPQSGMNPFLPSPQQGNNNNNPWD